MKEITRKEFLKSIGALGAGAALAGFGCLKKTDENPTPVEVRNPDSVDLAVVKGPDPKVITRRAVLTLGGMSMFVNRGDDVVIKPNICISGSGYEMAATTNPEVVGEIVRLCFEAGAGKVRVMDKPFDGEPTDAYVSSGIKEEVEASGGEMEVMSLIMLKEYEIPDALDLDSCKMYEGFMGADVIINVPIAKHHSLAGLTLGCKNLLGTTLVPSAFHRNMGDRVSDLVSLIRPDLTIVDAVRILTKNGPRGGRLDYVDKRDTVIVSADIVAADSYATSFFGKTGNDISYIHTAASRGIGVMDLSRLNIKEIDLFPSA